MPEIEYKIGTGVFKDETPLQAEGYAIDTQGYRIHRGGWQTQRGHERATSQTFTGLVRGSIAWADASGVKAAAFGTADNMFTFYGGAIRDITPDKLRGMGTDIFTTVDGEATITVTLENHGLRPGDTFNQEFADAVGGLTLDAAYEVVDVLDISRFTIAHGSPATSDETGGGFVMYRVPLDPGLVDGTGGAGWGTGTFGGNFYGTTTIGDTDARRWSMSPWGGNNVLAVPHNGALYEYAPSPTYPELITDDWTLDAQWSYDAGTKTITATAGTANRAAQNLINKLSGGLEYEVEFDLVRTSGSGTVQIKITSTAGGVDTFFSIGLPLSKDGTYRFSFQSPPSPTDFAFAKDTAFAGTISNLSVKLRQKAYRIMSAPQYCRGVMTDANNIAVVWGCTRQDGIYDRLALRWSNIGDNRTWISSPTNFAGENVDFGAASEIVSVIPTRRENLVFTDANVFAMRFTGQVGDAFAFVPLGGGAGLKAPGAVAAHSGREFWWGRDDNFYIYQGSAAQIIECPLRRDVVDNLAAGQDAKISFSIRAEFSEVRISYADKRDGNEVSRAIVFNWIENKWYNDTEDRTEYIGADVFADPIGFGKNGGIYYHDLGKTANGNALQASMTSGFFDLEFGTKLAALKRFFPDFDDHTGEMDLYILARDRARGPVRTYGPYPIRPDTSVVQLAQILARQFAVKLVADTPDLNHRFGSFRLEIDQTEAMR